MLSPALWRALRSGTRRYSCSTHHPMIAFLCPVAPSSSLSMLSTSALMVTASIRRRAITTSTTSKWSQMVRSPMLSITTTHPPLRRLHLPLSRWSPSSRYRHWSPVAVIWGMWWDRPGSCPYTTMAGATRKRPHGLIANSPLQTIQPSSPVAPREQQLVIIGSQQKRSESMSRYHCHTGGGSKSPVRILMDPLLSLGGLCGDCPWSYFQPSGHPDSSGSWAYHGLLRLEGRGWNRSTSNRSCLLVMWWKYYILTFGDVMVWCGGSDLLRHPVNGWHSFPLAFLPDFLHRDSGADGSWLCCLPPDTRGKR